MSCKIAFKCRSFPVVANSTCLRAILEYKSYKTIDRTIIMYHNILNITATLSALGVSRNLGGFSLPAIYLLSRDEVGA